MDQPSASTFKISKWINISAKFTQPHDKSAFWLISLNKRAAAAGSSQCKHSTPPSTTGLDSKAVPRFGEFVPSVAYHFYLNLPAAFSQPGNGLIVQPCTSFFCTLTNSSDPLPFVSEQGRQTLHYAASVEGLTLSFHLQCSLHTCLKFMGTL